MNDYIVNHPGGDGMQKLTPDILKFAIGRNGGLDLQDAAHLARSCKQLHGVFKPDITQRGIEKLLLHIVRGEQDAALQMMLRNPGLLLLRGSVTDYSGRKIEGVTALQCAYGAEDASMCEMIIAEMKKLVDGEKAASDQLDAKFSMPPSQRNTSSDKYFDGFAAVISKEHFLNDKLSAATENMLNQFRNDARPGVINHGIFHFNINALMNAVYIYLKHYDKWNAKQRELYWHKVVGYVERFLPACYAQVLCQGLRNVVRDNEPKKRECKLSADTPYYPLDTKRSERLGYDFAVYSEGIISGMWGTMTLPAMTTIPNADQASLFYYYLNLLSSSKEAELQQIQRNLKKTNNVVAPCVVM